MVCEIPSRRLPRGERGDAKLVDTGGPPKRPPAPARLAQGGKPIANRHRPFSATHRWAPRREKPNPTRVKKPRRRVVEVRRRVAKRGKADRAQLPGWRPRIRNCQVDGNGVDASRSTDSAKAFHAAKAVLGSAR
jgi:hypothetical protein